MENFLMKKRKKILFFHECFLGFRGLKYIYNRFNHLTDYTLYFNTYYLGGYTPVGNTTSQNRKGEKKTPCGGEMDTL